MTKNFKFHFSILKIKENFESVDKFTFQSVTADKVWKETLNLNDSKAMQYGDMLAKILKESIDIYIVALT